MVPNALGTLVIPLDVRRIAHAVVLVEVTSYGAVRGLHTHVACKCIDNERLMLSTRFGQVLLKDSNSKYAHQKMMDSPCEGYQTKGKEEKIA